MKKNRLERLERLDKKWEEVKMVKNEYKREKQLLEIETQLEKITELLEHEYIDEVNPEELSELALRLKRWKDYLEELIVNGNDNKEYEEDLLEGL